MRKRRLVIIALGVVILTLAAALLWRTYYGRANNAWELREDWGGLETNFGSVSRGMYLADTPFGSQYDCRYEYETGAVFSSRQLHLEGDIESQTALETIYLPAGELSVRYYDRASGQWYGGEYPRGCTLGFGMCFIGVGDRETVICLPQAYKTHENQTVEALEGQMGGLRATRTLLGWRIDVLSPVTDGAEIVDYFILQGNEQLVDWDMELAQRSWSGYQFTGDNRWLMDGYYYISPEDYVPTGQKYYYQLTAAYISCSFMEAGKAYPAAKYMGVAMMDVMARRMTQEGCFLTQSGSLWLEEEYGIQPGFYDTRFNNDLVRAFIAGYKNYGIEEFLSLARRYGDFFKAYAADNHDEYEINGELGWLVYDYKSRGSGKTHTSLNHQVAEMTLLEELYQLTGDEAYLETCRRLHLGLEATAELWLDRGGDLAYALLEELPVGEDYPYLTYNDLYRYNQLQAERTGEDDPLMLRLMEHKLKFMEENDITGYIGTESWRSEVEN